MLRFESSIGDSQIDKSAHHLFHMLLAALGIKNSKWWQLRKLESFKNKLLGLIGRLGLDEHALVLSAPCHCWRFHREEFLVCTLTKLAHGFNGSGKLGNLLHLTVIESVIR